MRQSTCPAVALPASELPSLRRASGEGHPGYGGSYAGSTAKLQAAHHAISVESPPQSLETDEFEHLPRDETASVVKGRFECGPRRGEGKSAIVYEAVDLTNGRRVAAKFARDMPASRKMLQQEKRMLNLVGGHDGIVQMVESSDTDAAALFFELADADLLDLVSSTQFGGVDTNTLRALFRQILQAVAHCHACDVYHLDLKPDNMLCFKDNSHCLSGVTVKLADFGTAAHAPGGRRLSGVVGTTSYMPPEVHAGESFRGGAADVWALGVVLYAMVMKEFPFDEPSIRCPKFRSLVMGSFQFPSAIGGDVAELLAMCWKINPDERITCERMLEHRFLGEGNQITRRSS